MSIKMRCTECGAKSQNGIFEHTDACRAKNLTPSIGYAQTPPTIAIEFSSKAEQRKFMKNLTSGGGATIPATQASDPHGNTPDSQANHSLNESKLRAPSKQSELERLIDKCNILKNFKSYRPDNVVLITIEDIKEIFHEITPYTMRRLDDLESEIAQATQEAAVEARHWAMENVGSIGADYDDTEDKEYRNAVEAYVLEERKAWVAQLSPTPEKGQNDE